MSVSPVAIPEIKKLIRSMTFSEAEQFATQAKEHVTDDGLIDFCLDKVKRRFADLPIWFNEDV
jgi:phosphoenolpyruvate-protein kinase (PTS system EI component)